ncbi:hypothetical protein BIW11_09926 [Tropilaelaps mercedesae]|uniref:Uncharacterized protein n=1 Tax=Tropilaelaps mercedesae TaxID=418985 RepID=A0A1V9XHX3_9ACAR|nr:hypothetical protein BIW11_09926 [Tropilaelaps mercedesae]
MDVQWKKDDKTSLNGFPRAGVRFTDPRDEPTTQWSTAQKWETPSGEACGRPSHGGNSEASSSLVYARDDEMQDAKADMGESGGSYGRGDYEETEELSLKCEFLRIVFVDEDELLSYNLNRHGSGG